jgi:hypothetical protein
MTAEIAPVLARRRELVASIKASRSALKARMPRLLEAEREARAVMAEARAALDAASARWRETVHARDDAAHDAERAELTAAAELRATASPAIAAARDRVDRREQESRSWVRRMGLQNRFAEIHDGCLAARADLDALLLEALTEAELVERIRAIEDAVAALPGPGRQAGQAD